MILGLLVLGVADMAISVLDAVGSTNGGRIGATGFGVNERRQRFLGILLVGRHCVSEKVRRFHSTNFYVPNSLLLDLFDAEWISPFPLSQSRAKNMRGDDRSDHANATN